MCGAGMDNIFYANGKIFICGNCIDLPFSMPYDTPLNEVSFDVIDFDRSCCFKEVFTGLVILADEDEEVQADIAICKSNSGISGSRLAAAHVRLGEKIGRHIATVFPEKNTSILVLERGGRFFGDGVYMGAGGIFYSMNPKQDDAPVINTERVVIVDSVINTGKSIMRIIDELKNHNPGIDVIIAANVIQNEAVELFKDYLVFATRLSKNSFVGVNQSKQTGKTGPDTADRLFNLIKKRY